MKKIVFLICGLLMAGMLYAQSDSTKRLNHYFQIQGNQLLRQLINFGGSSQNVVNPYTVNYSINSAEQGVGINFGLGFAADKFEQGDEFNQRETKLRELFFRIGFDKKHTLSEKWLIGWGIDLVREDVKNNTENTFQSGNDEVTSETTTTSKGWGFGPRMTLSYKLNRQIWLSTEANYYYTHTKTTSLLEQGSTETEEEGSTNSFRLIPPAVIYLTFAF